MLEFVSLIIFYQHSYNTSRQSDLIRECLQKFYIKKTNKHTENIEKEDDANFKNRNYTSEYLFMNESTL